jgi:outer membrane protein assembly factor BamE (lipoprotein component of BamABCDE complex)
MIPIQRALSRLVLAASVLASGCVMSQTTEGTPIDEPRLADIVVGESTRADVAALLGAPDDIIYSNLEHDPLFERAFAYRRTKRRTTFLSLLLFTASRSDTNADHVIVFFDDQGVVEDVASRLDMDEPSYGGPWGD